MTERESKTIANNLRRLIFETGLSPAEVARQIGIGKATLSKWMNGTRVPRMDNIDMLARYLGVTREQIVGKGEDKTKYQAVKIPVLGYVAAGIPLEMITDIVDDEEISSQMARAGEYFALRIKGKSMEPVFVEGDNVIVRKQSDVDSGDIAVVAVNGERATVKVVKKTAAGVTLIPKNPAFDVLFFTNEDVASKPVTIMGKVVELRRKL